MRHFKLRDNPAFCWRHGTTDLTKWSPETIASLQRLTPKRIEAAKAAYRERQRNAAARPGERIRPCQVS